jgi:hypothetical protein
MLTFGGGIRYCLGAHLAKAELAEALIVMRRPMPNIRLAGPAPGNRSSGSAARSPCPSSSTPATDRNASRDAEPPNTPLRARQDAPCSRSDGPPHAPRFTPRPPTRAHHPSTEHPTRTTLRTTVRTHIPAPLSSAGDRASAHRTTDQAHEAEPTSTGFAATLGEIGSEAPRGAITDSGARRPNPERRSPFGWPSASSGARWALAPDPGSRGPGVREGDAGSPTGPEPRFRLGPRGRRRAPATDGDCSHHDEPLSDRPASERS